MHIHFGIEDINTGQNLLIVPGSHNYNKVAETIRKSALCFVTTSGISTLFHEDEQHKRLGKSPAPKSMEDGIRANKTFRNFRHLTSYTNPQSINHFYTEQGLDSAAGLNAKITPHLEYRLPGASPFSAIPLVGLTQGILEGIQAIKGKGENNFSTNIERLVTTPGDIKDGTFPTVKDVSYRAQTINHRDSLLGFIESQYHTCGLR